MMGWGGGWRGMHIGAPRWTFSKERAARGEIDRGEFEEGRVVLDD